MPTCARQPRHRLVRPPSKQILQIREGAEGYDELDDSPYPAASPTWSSAANENGSPNKEGSSSVDEDEDDADGGRRVHSSSSPFQRHNDKQHRNSSSSNSNAAADARHTQRGSHASHRAMTASARRGGKSSRKNNDREHRSSSSHTCLSESRAGRSQQQQQSSPRSKCASPLFAGGRVTYYGPPPATALVSATLSSPSGVEAATPTSTSGEGGVDGGNCNYSAASTTHNTENAASTCTKDGATDCRTNGIASVHATCASPATVTVTPGSVQTRETPLTYAAVASAPPSSASSLHGKRLPQSRVGFGNFRKRVGGGGGCSSGTASVGSTARSTQGTPGTAGSPSHIFAEQHMGYSSSTRGHCASSCGFPSMPLTPLTVVDPSSATARGAERGMAPGHADPLGVDGGENEEDSQQEPPQALMPPIPPSLHRHHPTNLFLHLPHSHAQNSDSDEEVAVREDEAAVANGAPHQVSSATSPATQADTTTTTTLTEADLQRCRTSSTKQHTGPVIAAKAAAGLHLLPISTPSNAAPSVTSTPCGPTVPPQQQQQQQRVLRLPGGAFNPLIVGGEATPTAPTPQTTSNGNGRGMHKVSSTASFFNAVEIIPGLFLGSYGDATDTEALAAHGISLVVNCSMECPVTAAMASNPHHVRYVQCPLRDHSDETISPFFSPVTQIIHEQLHRRQINLQRTRKPGTTTTTTTTTGSACVARLSAEDEASSCRCCSCRGGSEGGNSGITTTTTTITTPTATTAGGHDGHDAANAELQDRLRWTWADETTNVWAVPPSPASPPLSVGGQPSLKEGKRETPRTPSSAIAPVGMWGRGSDGSNSLCTSGSPSPMPGRTATFPGVSSASTLTPTAAGADLVLATSPSSAAKLASTTTHKNSNSGTAAVAAVATATTPPTVVDPRDCGGVLVHCRMGVSRSATFVMAYLILYGFTLADLEDTASLFLRFLERERTIIEDAGGRARFALDGSGGCTVASPMTATLTDGAQMHEEEASSSSSTTTTNHTQSFGSPLSRSAMFYRNASPGLSSRFSTNVSSPTGSGTMTPAHTPLGGPRRPVNGLATWHAMRSSNSSNNNINNNGSMNSANGSGNGGGHPMHPLASPTLLTHRRSLAIPVSSPLFFNSGSVASPRSTTSSPQQRLYTPLTPLDVCARTCRPCHLLRIRERKMRQQAKQHLLISGAHQQQRREEEEEAEEQVIALAALSRMRSDAASGLEGGEGAGGWRADGAAPSAEAEEEEGHCAECGDTLCLADCSRSLGAMLPQRVSTQQQQEQLLSALRPMASSAPVVSHRGGFQMGRTLLEAAQDDEDAQARHAVAAGKAGQSDDIEDDDDDDDDEKDKDQHVGVAAAMTRQSPMRCSLDLAAKAGAVPLRNAFSVSKASAAAAAMNGDAGAQPPLGASPAAHARPTLSGQYPPCTPPFAEFPLLNELGGAARGRGGAASNSNYLFGSCETSSLASSHSMYSGDLAPAMTFREAFDAVKKEKSDVNPNIGFILALRELAGGGDFSLSTSL